CACGKEEAEAPLADGMDLDAVLDRLCRAGLSDLHQADAGGGRAVRRAAIVHQKRLSAGGSPPVAMSSMASIRRSGSATFPCVSSIFAFAIMSCLLSGASGSPFAFVRSA